MTRNEFQNILFRNTREMLSAIAGEWISAGGMNDAEEQSAILAASTDEQLAADCMDGFGLNQSSGDDFMGEAMPSHAEFNEYTAADLARAFADLR